MNTQIRNAVIRTASIQLTHFLSFCIEFDYDGVIQAYGDFVLDAPVPEAVRMKEGYTRTPSKLAGIVLAGIMDTVGVNDWNKLPGTPIRVALNKRNSGKDIVCIGNYLNDKWFSLENAMRKMKDPLIGINLPLDQILHECVAEIGV